GEAKKNDGQSPGREEQKVLKGPSAKRFVRDAAHEHQRRKRLRRLALAHPKVDEDGDRHREEAGEKQRRKKRWHGLESGASTASAISEEVTHRDFERRRCLHENVLNSIAT